MYASVIIIRHVLKTGQKSIVNISLQDNKSAPHFEDKWPNMRPIVLKLLQQEPVTQNEWQELFYSVHLVCLWDDNGGAKVKEALKEDISNFIKQAQKVRLFSVF